MYSNSKYAKNFLSLYWKAERYQQRCMCVNLRNYLVVGSSKESKRAMWLKVDAPMRENDLVGLRFAPIIQAHPCIP
jgi:hypothetical protein